MKPYWAKWAPRELFLAKSPCAWWVGVETRVRLGRRSAVGTVTTQTVAVDTALHASLPYAWKLQESEQALETEMLQEVPRAHRTACYAVFQASENHRIFKLPFKYSQVGPPTIGLK